MKETTGLTILSSEHPLISMHSGATVALFGEVLADIFPDRSVLGGAPFNVARHLKAFGLNPILITRTGNDALRAELLDAMSACGMATMGVQCDQSHPTGRVQVDFAEGTHRFNILPDQAYDHIQEEVVRTVALSIRPELVYFGTLAQRQEVSRNALKMLMSHAKASTFFDVNLRAPWFDAQVLRRSLYQADTVKLNNEELEVLAQLFAFPGDTLTGHAHAFIQTFDIGRVLVTCGAEGAKLVRRDGTEISLSPEGAPIEVVDTVGAGDGFSAVFMLGHLCGWSIEQTLARAHAFAAAICTLRGAAPEHADFYEPFLREWQS